MLEAVTSSPVKPKARSLGLTRSDIRVGVLLILVMLAGGYFRFVGQNWDDFVRFHPDERFLSGVVGAMGGALNFTDSDLEGQYQTCLARYPDNAGRGGFFDAQCSPMNPHNTGSGLMVYGTLPPFLVRWTADTTIGVLNFRDCVIGDETQSGSDIFSCLSGSATASQAQIAANGSFGTYTSIHLVGRMLSAMAEMGVILVVFFIGVQFHDKWIGLLAAALYAATVFSIQLAHFWTVDAMSNLFAALTIWCALRVQTDGKLGGYLGFGLFFGMALASRINTAPLVLLLLLAAGLRMLPAFDRRLAWRERGNLLSGNMLGLVLAGALTLLVFRVFNPYAFNGPGFFGLSLNPRWLADLAEAQHLVSGEAESPPNWQWVARTSYLFPLSNMSLWGMGILFAAAGWGAWAWSGWRLIRGRAGALRNLLPFFWILLYFAWLGKLWVMTMRYYLPMYPMFALLAAWGLVELIRRANRSEVAWRKLASRGLLVGVVSFTTVWALMFTNIYRHLFSPAAASHWISENVPGDFAMQVEGADAPLINIAVFNQPAFSDNIPLDQQASQYFDGQAFTTTFVAPADGTITKIHSPHLGESLDDPATETVAVQIGAPESNIVLAEGKLTADLKRDQHILGDAYDIPLDTPLIVKQGEIYSLSVTVTGGPIISAGQVFTWEGDWDEPVPPKVCALPSGVTLADDPPPGLSSAADCGGQDLWSGLINGYKLQVYWEEETYKRDLFQTVLDNTDYLVIGTNRRYDSQSRIPYRWPMTMRYYESLFNGELGFELAQTFQQTFQLGQIQISDQYLPTYSGPAWLNEFEAEEAFHVYDHPVVYIFRKTDAYSSDNTRAILNGIPLNKADVVFNSFNDPTLVGVVPLYSVPASPIPTGLQFAPDVKEIQYDNGTWSDRFHSDSPINIQPGFTILGWWFTIMLFGWATWPLLFTAFPGLADRGYGFAKLAGLLLTGWVAWVFSSARIPLWSQGGILIALLIVAGSGILLLWRGRQNFFAYLREHAARLLWIEAITLLAFAAFLFIRLSNPDLWHPSFGGEKPMDFAYFNGVLRSTVFPPIDPWYAGGYINYYYYGYVTVGVPVLLLGMLPSIAYNLIIPTLFAVTGIGAFSVAFNVVSAWKPNPAPRSPSDTEQRLESENFAAEQSPIWTREAVAHSQRAGNPWLAGIAALLLAVVLGNLDTPRVVVAEALVPSGFYQNPQAAQSYLVAEYNIARGTNPTGDDMAKIIDDANREAASPFLSALRGLTRALRGEQLNIAPNRWYWAPTRILSEPPVNSGGAIAEMPFFTFLYGDLHAHMIAMPMLMLVMGFVLNEVLMAGKARARRSLILSLVIGAVTVGLLRATNTWDWITFMLLSVLGLGFAWWISKRRINRSAVFQLLGIVGFFVVVSFLAALPYTTWYASVYNRALPYQGPRSPLWAYFTLHGMFLFLILSLLAWDTARWLRGIYVRSLRGMGTILLAAIIMITAILAGALLLSVSDYPVTIIAVPFLVWIALLFFRQGQSREMQYVLALAGLAIALTLGVEYIVLEGDIGRQNTVFKFYIQAWVLFSVVGGAALAWLVQGSARWSGGLRVVWYGVVGVLFVTAALYPVMASRGRSLDRMLPESADPNAPRQTISDIPFTLDGMGYMQYAMLYEGDPAILAEHPELGYFRLKDDYDMIRWLQENIQGTPTIMEGQSDREYRWESRVAIYTGLPAVVGWNFHQRQQRTFDPLPRIVQQRVANVNAFYSIPDVVAAWGILQHYDVSYIIVSSLEKAYYPATGLAKFDAMVDAGKLKVVYQGGAATVYEVIKDADFARVEGAAGGI